MDFIARKRSHVEIIGEILSLGVTGKTRMMYSVNMSHAQMEKYLDYLLSEGFIELVNDDSFSYRNRKKRILYRPTKEGGNLLESIKSIGDVIELHI
ncbi:winged helix-turn-helix domain-containing protein [Chloroflexota bacterium]